MSRSRILPALLVILLGVVGASAAPRGGGKRERQDRQRLFLPAFDLEERGGSALPGEKEGLAALDRLLGHEAKTAPLDLEARVAAVDVVSRAYLARSGRESALVARVDAIRRERSPDFVEPVDPDRDVLALLCLSIDHRLGRTLPPGKLPPHPAAARFPGAIPEAAPRTSAGVRIDTSVPRWHGTGLYAAPGEVVTVTFPRGTRAGRYRVLVGCHRDRIYSRATWKRFPEIVRRFEVPGPGKLAVACAFGGPLYVENLEPEKGRLEVGIANAVAAPRFVLGRTSAKQWKTIRRLPAPWAELECDSIVLTVPASAVRDIEDPSPALKRWQEIMDLSADLRGIDRRREFPFRIVLDREIAAGTLHSGYPIMGHDNERTTRALVTGSFLWGPLHEIGHNHQLRAWVIPETTEVSCNLWPLYVGEKLYGHETFAASTDKLTAKARGETVRRILKEPVDKRSGLVMLAQLVEGFGWKAFTEVFRRYDRIPRRKRPKTDAEKVDAWVVTFSQVVRRNLGPFFASWKVRASKSALASIERLPPWTEDPMR